MAGHAHDRAGTVVHQNVVGDPDRHFLAVERINGIAAGGNAVLFDLADVAGFFCFALLGDQLIDLHAKIGIRRRQILDDGMLRRKLHRRGAKNRIDARCEDADRRTRGPESSVVLRVIEFEIDQRAFAASDPVALHDADFVRPALQLVQTAQQFVGILRRAHKPLLQFALSNHRVFVTPAASIGEDLFVRQHGRTLRAPVHLAFLTVSQPLLEELEKEPLVPAVVFRKAGRDFARPVVGEAEALHLRLHIGNVAQRPLPRRRVVLDRRIFGGQAERVPSHGM